MPPAFDIVLMDLQMPEMDGHTATRILRADARFKTLPIVAMTAHALVEERQRCLESGMNDHITKPIDPDALFATIRRWVKPRQMPAAPAREASVAVSLPEIEGSRPPMVSIASPETPLSIAAFCCNSPSEQADAARRIADALAASDRPLAQRLAHTLKGVAGNLAIPAVQEVAAIVEREIRDTGVAASLPRLESILGPQADALRDALAEAPAAAPAAPSRFDPQAATAAVARLKDLVEANDGEAAEAFERLAQTLAGAVEAERLAALRAAIDAFDFDKASDLLSHIAQSCAVGA